MKRQKNKRRKKATKRRPLNLSSALDAHRKARVLHAAALKSHELSLEAHAAALDGLTEALMSRAVTDPIVEACIRAASSGNFNDAYQLGNIAGMRLGDLPDCLNSRLHLRDEDRFGRSDIESTDTVRVLKDNAYTRYTQSHGGEQ
jgi:hypothetical protein